MSKYDTDKIKDEVMDDIHRYVTDIANCIPLIDLKGRGKLRKVIIGAIILGIKVYKDHPEVLEEFEAMEKYSN